MQVALKYDRRSGGDEVGERRARSEDVVVIEDVWWGKLADPASRDESSVNRVRARVLPKKGRTKLSRDPVHSVSDGLYLRHHHLVYPSNLSSSTSYISRSL
jgi:hypothetical protein